MHREAHAELARSVERRRIARELHDFVTYSLGAVLVQSGGARRMLAVDPGRIDDARTVFATIEDPSR